MHISECGDLCLLMNPKNSFLSPRTINLHYSWRRSKAVLNRLTQLILVLSLGCSATTSSQDPLFQDHRGHPNWGLRPLYFINTIRRAFCWFFFYLDYDAKSALERLVSIIYKIADFHLSPPNKNQHDARCIRYQIEPHSTGDRFDARKVFLIP